MRAIRTYLLFAAFLAARWSEYRRQLLDPARPDCAWIRSDEVIAAWREAVACESEYRLAVRRGWLG